MKKSRTFLSLASLYGVASWVVIHGLGLYPPDDSLRHFRVALNGGRVDWGQILPHSAFRGLPDLWWGWHQIMRIFAWAGDPLGLQILLALGILAVPLGLAGYMAVTRWPCPTFSYALSLLIVPTLTRATLGRPHLLLIASAPILSGLIARAEQEKRWQPIPLLGIWGISTFVTLCYEGFVLLGIPFVGLWLSTDLTWRHKSLALGSFLLGIATGVLLHPDPMGYLKGTLLVMRAAGHRAGFAPSELMPYPMGITYAWALIGTGGLLWMHGKSRVSKSLLGTTLLYGLLGFNTVRVLEDLFLSHLALVGAETLRERMASWKSPSHFWRMVSVLTLFALPPIWLVNLKPWTPQKDRQVLQSIPDNALILNTFNAFYRVYYLEGSHLKMAIGIDPSFFPDTLVNLYLEKPDQLAQILNINYAVVTKDRSGTSVLASLASKGWRVLGEGDELIVLKK